MLLMEKTMTFFRGSKLETALMVTRANTRGEVARAVDSCAGAALRTILIAQNQLGACLVL